MIRRILCLSAILAGLAGCAPYVAKPANPEQFYQTLQARRLDEKPPGATWTGADLLAAALKRNPDIAAARARYQAAQAGVRLARVVQGSNLTLTAEYANEAPHWGYGGGLDVLLDVGGRRSARVSAAQLTGLQAFYDYAEAVWTVRVALERARIDLASAQREIALAEQATALRRERLDRLARRVAAGEDPRSVSLLAQTELSTAERRTAAARGRQAQALAALAKALGVSGLALQDVVLAPVADAPPPGDPATLRRDAALSRADVMRAIADYDLAENALRLEVAKQYPEVRLGPAYNYDHGVTKFPFNLGLALPPFDMNRSGIGQAEAERAAAGRRLEAAQASSLAAVDTAAAARMSAQNARDRVQAREIPASRATVEGAERALRAGEGDRVDTLASQAALIDTELNLLDAQRAELTAMVDLEDALRRAFDPAEAAVLQAAITPAGARP